ncbi:hypothetical protein [Natrinema salsiterrestre]|uniref:Uncharacterized protein n=1 Tax=Natrinema salsiterrestre TaxID=2950540 RepID=A0A9Q4Q5Q1_9EURY|nr:hypothetical protein [Natrinema salsiterrestre]MDF9748383.1 hypothetical protein [Natrinema salsiterrestre]
MTLKRRIRPLAGFAAVLTLLSLMVADTIHPEITLTLQNKALLVSLISALLGVDIALDQLPVTIGRTGTSQQNEGSNGGDGDD